MAWLTSRVWPVVPVKRLSAAKQRLRGALGSRGDEFARLLARRTIETLARSRTVAGILVVTSDPVVVEDAHAAGALVVDDAAHSLNAAYALGIAAAGGFGADLCALVPADLALLSAAGFDAIVFGYDDHRQRAGRSAVGLVRCKDGTGTNMALFDPHSDLAPTASLGTCTPPAPTVMNCPPTRRHSISIRWRICAISRAKWALPAATIGCG